MKCPDCGCAMHRDDPRMVFWCLACGAYSSDWAAKCAGPVLDVVGEPIGGLIAGWGIDLSALEADPPLG